MTISSDASELRRSNYLSMLRRKGGPRKDLRRTVRASTSACQPWRTSAAWPPPNRPSMPRSRNTGESKHDECLHINLDKKRGSTYWAGYQLMVYQWLVWAGWLACSSFYMNNAILRLSMKSNSFWWGQSIEIHEYIMLRTSNLAHIVIVMKWSSLLEL